MATRKTSTLVLRIEPVLKDALHAAPSGHVERAMTERSKSSTIPSNWGYFWGYRATTTPYSCSENSTLEHEFD